MNVVQDEELVGDNIARLLLLRQQARILACIHCSISAVPLAVVGAGTKTCTQRQATLTAAQMAGSVFLLFSLWYFGLFELVAVSFSFSQLSEFIWLKPWAI